MEIIAKKIKPDEIPKKNKVYEMSEDVPCVTIEEKHDDSSSEMVELTYQLKSHRKGYFASEYRNKDMHGSKAADILCIVIDSDKKIVHTEIYDIKRTITGFDIENDVETLRKESVKRIKEFITQIEDEMIHKDALIGGLIKYDGYEEHNIVGIITREFDEDKLRLLADKLQNSTNEEIDKYGLIGMKHQIRMDIPKNKEVQIIRDFANKKIFVCNKKMELSVQLLKYEKDKKGYYIRLTVCKQI